MTWNCRMFDIQNHMFRILLEKKSINPCISCHQRHMTWHCRMFDILNCLFEESYVSYFVRKKKTIQSIHASPTIEDHQRPKTFIISAISTHRYAIISAWPLWTTPEKPPNIHGYQSWRNIKSYFSFQHLRINPDLEGSFSGHLASNRATAWQSNNAIILQPQSSRR